MIVEEAKAVVLYEGLPSDENADDGLYIMVRMGNAPDAARMRRLLDAPKNICDDLEGETRLDRSLDYALWVLGETVMSNMASWQGSGKVWRDGFEDNVAELQVAVESLFMGEWIGSREIWIDGREENDRFGAE